MCQNSISFGHKIDESFLLTELIELDCIEEGWEEDRDDTEVEVEVEDWHTAVVKERLDIEKVGSEHGAREVGEVRAGKEEVGWEYENVEEGRL